MTGAMFEREGPLDGVAYAIGFEMRLPRDWNGRFWYQANGGIPALNSLKLNASVAAADQSLCVLTVPFW